MGARFDNRPSAAPGGGVRARRWRVVLAASVGLCFANFGWAAISSCPTSASGSALSSFGAQSASNGCSQVDLNFDNFSVTTTGNSAGNTGDPTTGDVELYGTGTSDLGPILAHFDSTDSSDGTQWVATEGTRDLVSTLDFQVATNNSAYDIDSLTLSLGDYTTANPSNAGNYVEVMEQFCLGDTTFSCSTSSSNYGYIEEKVTFNESGAPTISEIVCTPGASGCTTSTGSLTLTLPSGYTTIGISEVVTVNREIDAGQNIYLDSFSDQFGTDTAVPEPGAFWLLATALAGVGIVRLRKHSA